MRKQINLSGSVQMLMIEMAEGNPGALTVLMKLIEGRMVDILHLDDMNMRGSQIWVGYKDFAGCNLEKFSIAIRQRDTTMIEVVNKNSGIKEMAVANGASMRRPK